MIDLYKERCKYQVCGKVGHLEKDCQKKKADLKKRMKQKAELTLKKQRDRDVVTHEYVGVCGGQFPGFQDYSDCHECGSNAHFARKCSAKIRED